MSERVWIVGVGNVFLGDDGFGVAVVDRLRREALPSGVRVEDYGIRATHLAYALLDPPELLLVVDAASQGEAPGTVYLLEPDTDGAVAGVANAHAMDLGQVFATTRSLGGTLPRIRIVGCEPGFLGEHLGLSAPVERAVETARALLLDLVRSELSLEGARP
jgi:hydrogenase maturation protease